VPSLSAAWRRKNPLIRNENCLMTDVALTGVYARDAAGSEVQCQDGDYISSIFLAAFLICENNAACCSGVAGADRRPRKVSKS
jgi:hypothetical protein